MGTYNMFTKMDKYQKVEALRYLYLDELPYKLKKKTVDDKSDILIIGDVIPKTTRLMLSCIQKNDSINDSSWKVQLINQITKQ